MQLDLFDVRPQSAQIIPFPAGRLAAKVFRAARRINHLPACKHRLALRKEVEFFRSGYVRFNLPPHELTKLAAEFKQAVILEVHRQRWADGGRSGTGGAG